MIGDVEKPDMLFAYTEAQTFDDISFFLSLNVCQIVIIF